MTKVRTWLQTAGLCLLIASSVQAVSVTGSDWIVHYNLPDQNSGAVSPGEYAIRDALLARINALQSNDAATLATYTFSGNTASAGAAGPILQSISNALARGAKVSFVADGDVYINSNFWPGISLSSLAARPGNSLVLSQDNSSFGIMHDKLGVFRYGATNRCVFIASWNFTGGASIFQWNIAIEVFNDALYGAYSNEMAELLAGRFHDHAAKSHAHDGAAFTLAGSWSNNWVRFAPYPDGTDGGTNAQTDIVNLISNTSQEIVFALNTLTRPLIRDALVAAANRGVSIHGVIPQSDWTDPADYSYAIYTYLTNTTNYATTNIVHFVTPYAKADGSAYDTGQDDLVHEKFMVIDPWTDRPVLIHGSANWTDAALVSAGDNDENLVFIRQKEIVRVFYSQFKRMTGLWQDRDDFWWAATRSQRGPEIVLWTTDTNSYVAERSTVITNSWLPFFTNRTGEAGSFQVETNVSAAAGFYRAFKTR